MPYMPSRAHGLVAAADFCHAVGPWTFVFRPLSLPSEVSVMRDVPILIVDDDPSIRETVSDVLGMEGYPLSLLPMVRKSCP